MSLRQGSVLTATLVLNFALLAVLLLFTPTSRASDPLFQTTTPLAFSLQGPFARIDRERDKAQEYDGTLSYVDEGGATVTLHVALSVRGKFRLSKEVCSNAQLWLNFKKGQVSDTLFANQNKLKLVVQCRDPKRYSTYIAREHQAYQMFAELSELSFDTRLVNVNYRDSETGDEKLQPAIILEHHKRLAHENNLEVLHAQEANQSALDSNQSTTLALFSYMIANTDYSMITSPPGENCCHNVKVLEDASGTLYPVPYDFDSTGFVNPPYAIASAGIGQDEVTDRVYRGFCASEETLNAVVDAMRTLRPRFEAIIAEHPLSTRKGIRNSTRFLGEFYDIVDNPEELQKRVTNVCR